MLNLLAVQNKSDLKVLVQLFFSFFFTLLGLQSISGGCCVTGKSSVFVVFLGGQTKYLQISFCDKMFQNSAGKLVDNLRF